MHRCCRVRKPPPRTRHRFRPGYTPVLWATVGGKLWAAGLLLGLKKKMDAAKAENGEKEGSMSMNFSLKSVKGMMDMMGGFTVLRMSGMVGMVGVSFTKEELLAMNEKLNRIKAPKK